MNTPRYFVRRRPAVSKTKWMVLASLVLAFVLSNTVIAVIYHGRTYPRTRVGAIQVGSITYKDLAARAGGHTFAPAAMTVTYKGISNKVEMSALGVSVDAARIKQAMSTSRAWPPAANFVAAQTITLPFTINDTAFANGFAALQKKYEKKPAAARLVMEDYIFTMQPAVKGITLDRTQFRQQLVEALQAGRTTLELPVALTTPQQLQMADQQYGWDELIKQQHTALTYYYVQKTRQLAARDVGMWYVPKGDTYVLSDDKIRATIARLGADAGITITNMPEALAATKQALQGHQSLAFTLLTTPPAL